MQKYKNIILIAPLDWGLGHATRCIPIITFLNQIGCKIIIATDAVQETLLKKEFPLLHFVQLPGYNIAYSKRKRFFLMKIVLQLPKILKNIRSEKKWLENFILHNSIDCVISDNRYGLYSKKVKSVFITHQLLIKAPFKLAEVIIQQLNYCYIQKFSECWVPDEKGFLNIAGKLSHPLKLPALPVKYIGGLSRFEKVASPTIKYNVLIILSGPEPQRTVLEDMLLLQLDHFTGKALLIRGLPGSNEQLKLQAENVIIKNHLPAEELAALFAESQYIVCRSGYTTVMDICKLKKKSILIPTPGQTEQEYLAQHLSEQGWCMAASQEGFSLTNALEKARSYNYMLPELNMHAYKATIETLLQNLSIDNN